MQNALNSAYHLRDRLARIWSYLPVLWRVYDFDWTSAFYVLEHQLSRIEYCIENGHTVQRGKDVRNIQIVRECLRRLAEDDLAEKEFEAWHKTFEGEDFLDRLNKPRTPEQTRLFKIASEKETHTRELLEDLLFKTMQRHYRHWWD